MQSACQAIQYAYIVKYTRILYWDVDTGLPTKDWEFRDDSTEFVVSVFLYSGILAGQNWHISVLNHLVNHYNTQLNAKT